MSLVPRTPVGPDFVDAGTSERLRPYILAIEQDSAVVGSLYGGQARIARGGFGFLFSRRLLLWQEGRYRVL